jgi:hypothetical protein
MKMTHKLDPWKILWRINATHAKKEFKLKTLFKQKNCMQGSSLNTIPSIQKYNSRISVILIYYYALCKGNRGRLGERCSRCFFCHRCRHKHTCGVAVVTACICLRGREFESPWGHLCFLILAKCGLYVGMSFAGREE